MSDNPRQIAATDTRNLSSCTVCGVSIEPDPPDGFSEYARQVAGYLDHFADAHPDHEILNAPEGYL